MSSSRLEILCSPCPTDNAFVTWGSDLSLYRVEEFNQTSLLDDADFEHKSGFFRLSDRFFAYTVGRTKEFKFIKHVAWCPRSAGHYLPQMPPPIIAVGLTSGQVILTSFSQTLETDIYLGGSASSGSDITAPKYQRQCNGLSFNGSDPTLLAAGFDRHRNDYAVVVWDASRAIANAANSSSTSIFLNSTSTGFGAGFRATMEVGLSEQCNSLTWMCSQPKTLAAGMNGKHLKFYDLRDNLKQVQTSAPTKGVNGVCVDPFFEFRLASYASDGGIMIWDRRNFERPIYTVGEGPAGSKPTMGSASSSSSQSGGVQICKLGWCPTRSGLLAACSKDSAMIRLYDVHSDNTKEGGVHNVLERMEWPGKPSASPIVSFTWNAGPSVRHLLALTADGSILDHQVSERITVSWSPEPELAWTEGTNSLYVLSKVTGGKTEQPSTAAPSQGLPFTYPIQVECKEYFDDISVIMKTRAKMQYGLKTVSLSDNGEMVNDPQLRIAWDWMELSRRLQLDRYSRSGSQTNTSYWASVPASNTAPNFQKWSSKNQGVRATTPHRFQVTPVRLMCKHPGLRWILCGESGKSIAQKSEAVEAPWIGLELGPRTVLARVYQSEARTFCLRMCGWGFDRGGSSLNLFLDKLTGNRQYERAAAIAVFHLHVRRAMQILQEGGSKGHSNKARPLHLVAMALAGFTDDRNSLWRETCTRLKTELNEPYLSALFTFLTADPDKPEVVLNERMAVKDKVAFALTFLPDAKLYDYITKLTDKLTDRGALDGLLLTGLAVSVVNSGPPNQLQDSSTTATRTTTMTDPFTGQLLTVNTSVSSDVHGPPSDPLLATPTNQPAPYLQQTGVPVFTGTSAIASIAYTTTTVSTAVSAIAGGNAMAAGSSNPGSSPGTQGLAASGPIITSNDIASGLTLLQNYVDRTGDVQTAALMALHAEVLTDERANMWLQTYRNLLDSWSYWNERCLCDVEATKLDPSSKCPPQIYVCCTFCGRGISPSVIKSLGTQRSMYFRMQAHNQAGKTKLSACPSCRKPLPRCSLCQVHLGTASGVQDMLASFHGGHSATSPTSGYAASHRSPSKALSPASVLNPIPLQTSHHRGSFDSVIAPLGLSEATRRKLSPMDSWFTWCQSCRHGGHANHILRWFKENEDCPVTGCSCKCLSLDPVGPKRSPVKRNIPAAINPEALIDGIASALASQGITNAAVSSRF